MLGWGYCPHTLRHNSNPQFVPIGYWQSCAPLQTRACVCVCVWGILPLLLTPRTRSVIIDYAGSRSGWRVQLSSTRTCALFRSPARGAFSIWICSGQRRESLNTEILLSVWNVSTARSSIVPQAHKHKGGRTTNYVTTLLFSLLVLNPCGFRH